MKTEPLFEPPPRVVRVLSRLYATPDYRVRRGEANPRWTRISAKVKPTCEECFAEQHEGSGAPRSKASYRRTLPGVPPLALCGPHKTLWMERDAADRDG